MEDTEKDGLDSMTPRIFVTWYASGELESIAEGIFVANKEALKKHKITRPSKKLAVDYLIWSIQHHSKSKEVQKKLKRNSYYQYVIKGKEET